MNNFHLNKEFMKYANKNSKLELIMLVILILFMMSNILLYSHERKLQKIKDKIVGNQTVTDGQDEYVSLLLENDFVSETDVEKHLKNISKMNYDDVIFEGNSMFLIYENLTIKDIKEQTDILKKNYKDVRVEQINQNESDNTVKIEVRI